MTKPSISFVRNVKKGCIFDENFGVVAKRKALPFGRKPQDKADAIGQMVELLAKKAV